MHSTHDIWRGRSILVRYGAWDQWARGREDIHDSIDRCWVAAGVCGRGVAGAGGGAGISNRLRDVPSRWGSGCAGSCDAAQFAVADDSNGARVGQDDGDWRDTERPTAGCGGEIPGNGGRGGDSAIGAL